MGIGRVVFSSYSAKAGTSSFCRVQMRLRSSASATLAFPWNVSVPTSTVTSGTFYAPPETCSGSMTTLTRCWSGRRNG